MAVANAEEIYRKISPLIDSQFPGFIREEGPNFVAFLKAYYEYAEQSGNPVDVIRGLPDYKDVDRTTDAILDYFVKDFMPNIPKSALADKRLMVKNIRQFYRSRGSEFSYRFLFRALFGLEIDLLYPSDNILRASDGNWVKEKVIRVSAPYTVSPINFDGRTLTGLTSGATGRVQFVNERKINGVAVWEITLEDISGNYKDGEIVRDTANNTAMIFTGAGTLTGIRITDGGSGHSLGDLVSFYSATDAGTGILTSVADNSAATIRITRGGTGYTLGSNTNFTINGGSGTGLTATVIGISNTEVLTVGFTDTIGALRNVPLNRGTKFVTGGSNTSAVSAKLALANVASTLSAALQFITVTAGSIDTIRITSVGKNYTTLPTTVTCTDSDVSSQKFPAKGFPVHSGTAGSAFRGNNASFTLERRSGSAVSMRITRGGSAFVANQSIVVNNLTQGADLLTSNSYNDLEGQERSVQIYNTYNGAATPDSGLSLTAVIDIGGRYTDTRGFLSGDNFLHDNNYYQPFSYVVKVSKAVEKYRDVLKRILHPAGTKFFGMYNIDTSTDMGQFLEFIQVINVVYTVALTETVTLTDTPTAVATYPAAKTETITVTDTPSANASYAASDTETVTVTDTPTAVATYPGAATETITVTDTPTAERFITYPSTQVSIQVANNIISNYSSLAITSYSALPIGIFDGTPRLVVTVVGAPTFTDGTLKAETGSFSVSSPSSNLLFTVVGNAQGNTIYSVNTIFSDTSFTIRTNYLPVTSNATFKYSHA